MNTHYTQARPLFPAALDDCKAPTHKISVVMEEKFPFYSTVRVAISLFLLGGDLQKST